MRVNEIISKNKNGLLIYTDVLEDIHTHVENWLFEDIGNIALKLHTGRSRNDQIATLTKMYLKNTTNNIITLLKQLQNVFLEMSNKNNDIIFPGYTHGQRAQPILFSDIIMAFYSMLDRDITRFQDCSKRMDVLPLGSGALAGTNYNIDRNYVAKNLIFLKFQKTV